MAFFDLSERQVHTHAEAIVSSIEMLNFASASFAGNEADLTNAREQKTAAWLAAARYQHAARTGRARFRRAQVTPPRWRSPDIFAALTTAPLFPNGSVRGDCW
jgi:hypothetical protein